MPTRVTLYHVNDGAVTLDSCEVEHALKFPEWRQTPWPARADADEPAPDPAMAYVPIDAPPAPAPASTRMSMRQRRAPPRRAPEPVVAAPQPDSE